MWRNLVTRKSLFLEFWNQFKTAIDENPYLTDVEKFCYLKSLVSRIATNAICGFSFIENNYAAVTSLLKERFGRQDLLVHLKNLLNIECRKRFPNTRGTRNLYD